MIPSSPLVRGLSLGAALAVHMLALVTLAPGAAPMIEAGGAEAELRLGNGFADLAAGTLTPLRAETVTPVPATTPPSRSDVLPPVSAAPVERVTAATAPVLPIPVAPRGADRPPLAGRAPAQRIEGQPPAEPQPASAPDSSPRPRQRPAETAAPVRKARQETTRAAPTPSPQELARPASRGNGARDMRAGAATGRSETGEQRSGAGGARAESGNAAVSNYPGQVLRKLARMGKPRVRAQGAATIAFSIGVDGRLTSVSLTKSSGSNDLDRAAIRLVRAAEPFPRPPAGAQRSFTIEIRAR
ncbi:outer membrane transport energization protein TonB [Albidovulum inexpectatum]|uniref:Outer membrane transport energization protein TonB n=1 Tax=Albidovulum inexpectatum TaxID=196587 RepID=A0A2S5JHI5_9RHOB|nr:TonB family protein [Albidovulum inexpectatum]PPB80841.1 outer membrane transport energization protein TonB [Albidovulum inexpectatum]